MHKKIILASRSPARAQQLKTLFADFAVHPSEVEEYPMANETPSALALRLAEEKAMHFSQPSDALVIGADQTANLRGQLLRKPQTPDEIFNQLRMCSGQRVTFYSAVCVYDVEQETSYSANIETKVRFKNLSPEQIRSYILKEEALYCLGGFKSEGLGIALFSSMESEDPSAIVGLPLIALSTILTNLGMDPLLSGSDFS